MKQPSTNQIRLWANQISKSDRKAFDHLFRFMYPRLVRFAFRYTRHKAAASDIVQDVFVGIWEKRHQMDPDQSVKAYLYRSVRNRALNYLRDHSAETVGLDSLPDSQLESTEQAIEQNTRNPLADLLKTWIKDLPQRQREAFELSRFEGLDHDEIAGVMEVSPNTVNNHIVAALNNLKSRYNTYQNEVHKPESYD